MAISQIKKIPIPTKNPLVGIDRVQIYFHHIPFVNSNKDVLGKRKTVRFNVTNKNLQWMMSIRTRSVP